MHGLIFALVGRIPAWITLSAYFVAGTAFLLARYLFSTLPGLLITALVTYRLAQEYSTSKPLGLGQLVLWFDGLETEAVGALTAATLTVLGFVIAFQTANASWREQRRTELRISVANEIEEFFDEAHRHVTAMQIYADAVLRLLAANEQEAYAWRGLIEDARKFRSHRDSFSEMAIRVHRITGKNFSLIQSLPLVTDSIEGCIESMDKIARAMWLNIPVLDANLPMIHSRFINGISVSDLRDFVAVCKEEGERFMGLSGGARGVLLQPVNRFTIHVLVNGVSRSRKFAEVMDRFNAHARRVAKGKARSRMLAGRGQPKRGAGG